MSLSDLSSLTSSDEEVQHNPRVFKERVHPFDYYNDQEFKNRYRLSKEVIQELLPQLEYLKPATQRNQSISVLDQLLLTIQFYASGAFQITVADHIHIHKSTACRIIKKVSLAIAQLRPQYVNMPRTQEERCIVKNAFYNIKLFPNVIGAIDCTHVKIQSPGGVRAELFRNRKGYFSINVQAVCDANLRIMDIVARWPGSAHDSTIFNDCHLRADFEVGRYENDVMLGDSGYPCRSYLLTPFLNPASASEEAYNDAHISTRNAVERCFGVLKRRFPCLSMGIRVNIDTTMNVIVACAVLHNIALNNNDIIEDEPLLDDNNIMIPNAVQQANDNTAVRASLLNTHFYR